MARAPLFGVFILALCLVACVCADGDEAKKAAKAAAEAARASAKNALDKVTAENGKAVKLLTDIETSKQNADAAVAEAEKAAKDNKEVKPIAQKAKEVSEGLVKLHTDSFTGDQSIVEKIKALLTEATSLEKKAKDLLDGADAETDSTKTTKSAEEFKKEVTALDEKIDAAMKEVSTAQTVATEAAKKVEEIKEALKSATTSAANAPDQKPDAEAPISGATKKPDATQDNNKVNPQDAAGGPVSGDSAMTVSVTLLMALIACAALQ